MTITRYFRAPGLSPVERSHAVTTARTLGLEIDRVSTEHCFYVASDGPLDDARRAVLLWLLAETFEPDGFGESSFLDAGGGEILEVGPRMTFSTAWSTNAVSVCRACGLDTVSRIERSRRFALPVLNDAQRRSFLSAVHEIGRAHV